MYARIPLWFYGITSIIYLLSSVVCFLVAYFSYRVYKMDRKRKILFLLMGFLLLGLGFLVLAAPSAYIYIGLKNYKQTALSINRINYIGFLVYYVLSTLAYLAFFLMYSPLKLKGKTFIIFVPLWYADSNRFHIYSIVLLLAVFVQTVIKAIRRKKLNNWLVMFSFLCLLLFHFLLLLTSFSVTNFILANGILILGFVSLLYMLIRVNYIGKEKVKA